MDTKEWSDIGYNWLVSQAGMLYVGRGWTAQGTHSAGENRSHISVCFIGHSTNVVPTPAALNAIRWVYEDACRQAGRTLSYSGHGQLPGEATQCPGSNLIAWIADGMPLEEETMIHELEVTTWTGGNIPQELAKMTDPIDVPALPEIGYAGGQVPNLLAQKLHAISNGVDDILVSMPTAADVVAAMKSDPEFMAMLAAAMPPTPPLTVELTGAMSGTARVAIEG